MSSIHEDAVILAAAIISGSKEQNEEIVKRAKEAGLTTAEAVALSAYAFAVALEREGTKRG